MSENEKLNATDQAERDAASFKDRRSFLKLGGASLAALALSGAVKAEFAGDAPPSSTVSRQTQQTIELGSGDTGVLNFAYLLEQLEADFYTRVVANNFYSGATAEEQQILTDLRDHETIHRQFFQARLGASAIPTIQFDFTLIDFNSRDSVLTASQVFEDTGVSAYNGAGQLLESAENLAIAGKIVSVEARHAAAIRDLRIPKNGFFADSGTDFALDPLTVLTLARPFIPRTITVSAVNLPRTIVV